MKEKRYWVYILSNKWKAIYVGVTNDLFRRVYQHKTKFFPRSFTARYSINRLVYFEETNDVLEAIKREKQLKYYHRKWENELIEKENLEWNDLAEKWY